MMLRRLVCAAALIGLAGCNRGQDPAVEQGSGDTTPPSTELTITARGTSFDKAVLRVPAGEPLTITFRNEDTAPHSFHVMAGSAGDFMTEPKPGGPDAPAELLKFRIRVPAMYAFQCDVHPAIMKGTLEVVADG